MTQPAPHTACDGCGIAKDDLRDIEMLQRRDEIWQELFRNASRIRKAMRSNSWIRPIFRKYKRTCRDILEQKKKEATTFTQLCDHCGDGDKNDLKLIREELEQIHSKIKSLEDMRSASSSSSELSDDSDVTFHNDEHEKEDNNGDHGDHEECNEDNEEDAFSVFSSSSSSSSSSTSSSDMDMEDFV